MASARAGAAAALVVSDVHLSPLVPDGDARMPYRQRRHVLDAALAALLDGAVARTGGALELVFGGDALDFDAPSPGAPGQAAFAPPASRTEAGAVAMLGAILDDHPVVVAALGRALARGATVVFVAGNHDAQLAFPAVRRALADRLCTTAASHAGDARGRVLVRTLFHRTAHGVHVEHGHQYDPLCALARLVPPTGAPLEETLGSVVASHVPALLASDPYAADPFAARPADLAAAWHRARGAGGPATGFYATGAASLARAALRVRPGPAPPAATAALCATVAAETGADPRALAAHVALFAPKATADALAAPGALRGYAADVDARLRAAAAALARIHGAPAVLFGHTHVARAECAPGGVVLGNTGAWTPGAGGTYAWIAPGGASGATVALRGVAA